MEKTYKKVTFYGKLTTLQGSYYYVLAPYPLEQARDSWMNQDQQVWLVVPAYSNEYVTINDKTHVAHGEPHHLITSFPTLELFVCEGYVWDGGMIDTDEIKECDEPTTEDTNWLSAELAKTELNEGVYTDDRTFDE